MSKSYKRGINLTLIVFLIIFSGCASILSKSTYPISVNSNPTGAKITVEDKKGAEVFSGITPASFLLKAKSGYFAKAKYDLTFDMEGYETKTVPINFSFDGWFVGNLLFGGLIGILIVDPLTGAMWKLKNANINEALIQNSARANQPELKVLSYLEISDEMRKNLVRIN